MSKIARFVIWICSKFAKNEIQQIIAGLLDVLEDRNPEVKPKDDFKEKHPNYRNFSVDPLAPLTKPPQLKQPLPLKNYKQILAAYEGTHGKPLSPVKYRPSSPPVPQQIACPCCNAPHPYLYYNDGLQRTQLRCKLCHTLFQVNKRFQKGKKTKYYCPYCHHALFTWKQKKEVTIYKCCNDHCPHRTRRMGKLNEKVKALAMKRSSQFKLSYQTVLNYAAAAAFSCQRFNFTHKRPMDEISAGDDAYIKVMGKHHFVSFFISSKNHKITAYHGADSRDTLPAIIAMKEAIRTADPNQTLILVTDGNPSSPAAIHFLNAERTENPSLQHRKVIGLQNLDSESEEFRPYKQLIERLNRTFKHHVKPSHGFDTDNGALALITLFVIHYNLLDHTCPSITKPRSTA